MKKKEQILAIAIRLFNDKGYANVSLREIAKESGTTIGNLTYHFPQKEDLVLSLLDSLQIDFILDVPKDKHRAELLSHLLNSFLVAEKNEQEYPFYYKNIYDFTMCSETLAKRNKAFAKELYDYYIQILTTLREDKVLERAEDSDIINLSYIIVLTTSTWLQGNAPYNNELLPKLRLSETLSGMIRPYIRAEYREEFEKLLLEKRIVPES
ncbi:MAG: TetR family transcriptional regulator [Lachnospiraceae bacterium]|nr:TetR family transcriptional regulator [Lachnospiraceae bacterium]